uniref:Uncharacterized protein n=1 Tax=Romanomermis culicivorax TaxID=13658 RepID=A0A915KCJ3_ROMCU
MPKLTIVETEPIFAKSLFQETAKLNKVVIVHQNDALTSSQDVLENKMIELLKKKDSISEEVTESSTSESPSSDRTPRFSQKEEELLDHVWQSLKNEDLRPKKTNDTSVPLKTIPLCTDVADRRLSKHNIIDLMRMASKILASEEALLEPLIWDLPLIYFKKSKNTM